MPNTSRSRRSVISPSTWTLATALLWITSQAAMADRPYRILKVDDLPDASASRSDGQLLSAYQRGDYRLFPAAWSSVIGLPKVNVDLRFRIRAQNNVYGTLASTDPTKQFLYPSRWSLDSSPTSCTSGAPSFMRHPLLDESTPAWNVLESVNESGFFVGASANGVSNGTGSVAWTSYVPSVWFAGSTFPSELRWQSTEPGFAKDVGPGLTPFVVGAKLTGCSEVTTAAEQTPTFVQVSGSWSSAPWSYLSVTCPASAVTLVQRGAAHALRTLCGQDVAPEVIGWSECMRCSPVLNSLCGPETRDDRMSETDWRIFDASFARWHSGQADLLEGAPAIRQITASNFASAGSALSRYRQIDGAAFPGFPCQVEHAEVRLTLQAGFIDLHCALPGSGSYDLENPTISQPDGPDPDGRYRINSRIASIREQYESCGQAQPKWVAAGSRFGESFNPDPDPTTWPGNCAGVLWRSFWRNSQIQWCGVHADDLICNLPNLSQVDGISALHVTALHDIDSRGLAVGIAYLKYPNGTSNICRWGAEGPKLVVLTLAADFTGDSWVDGGDLGALLGHWTGTVQATSDAEREFDLNDDGRINGGDLGLLLGQWGGGTSNLTPGTVLSWGGDCGQSVPIIPAALTAVNALGFEDLDQFASIGLMLGAEGFQPFMDLAADMTRTIVFEGAPQ